MCTRVYTFENGAGDTKEEQEHIIKCTCTLYREEDDIHVHQRRIYRPDRSCSMHIFLMLRREKTRTHDFDVQDWGGELKGCGYMSGSR